MKGIKENIDLPTGAIVVHPILLQPAWYQYIIFEYSYPLGANQYYVNGFMEKESDSFVGPQSGNVLMYDNISYIVSTSGSTLTRTRFPYKLFNLEVKKPTKFTIAVGFSGASGAFCVVYLKYSKEKLLEVV